MSRDLVALAEKRTMSSISRDILDSLANNCLEAFKIDRELWETVPVGVGNFRDDADYIAKATAIIDAKARERAEFSHRCDEAISETELILEMLKQRAGVSSETPEALARRIQGMKREVDHLQEIVDSGKIESRDDLAVLQANLESSRRGLEILDESYYVEAKVKGIGRYRQILAEISEKGSSERLRLLKDIYEAFYDIREDGGVITASGISQKEKSSLITLENRLETLKQVRGVAMQVPTTLRRIVELYGDLKARHMAELDNFYQMTTKESSGESGSTGRSHRDMGNVFAKSFNRIAPFVSQENFERELDNMRRGIPYYMDQLAIMIWGKPGIGKTAMVQQVAGCLNILDRIYSAAQIDSTTFSGMPSVDRSDMTLAMLLSKTITECRFSPFILVIDEFNRATDPALSNAMLRVVANSEVGGKKLFPGGVVVAINNPPDNSHNMRDGDAAASNRFLHVDMDVDETIIRNGWRTWAEFEFQGRGKLEEIARMVVAFLTEDPDGKLFFVKTPEDRIRSAEKATYPTPRSWTRVVRVLGQAMEAGDLSVSRLSDITSGIVGRQASTAFVKFMEGLKVLPTVDELLERFPKPEPDEKGGKPWFFMGDVAYFMQSKSRLEAYKPKEGGEKGEGDEPARAGKGRKRLYEVKVDFARKFIQDLSANTKAWDSYRAALAASPSNAGARPLGKETFVLPQMARAYGEKLEFLEKREKDILYTVNKVWGDVSMESPAYQYILQRRIVDAFLGYLKACVVARQAISAAHVANLLKLAMTYPYDEGRYNMLYKMVFHLTNDSKDSKALRDHLSKHGVEYPGGKIYKSVKDKIDGFVVDTFYPFKIAALSPKVSELFTTQTIGLDEAGPGGR